MDGFQNKKININFDEINNIKEIGSVWEKNGKKRLYFDKDFFYSYTEIGMTAPTRSSGTTFCKLIVDGEQISGSKTGKITSELGITFRGNRDWYFYTSDAFYDFADEKIKVWRECGTFRGFFEIDGWGMPELAEKITELVSAV